MSNIWSRLIDFAGNITGVLPLANGGTAKALTPAAGGLVWTDADSMEVGAAGTTSMWTLSGGTTAPTFSNTSTTGKVIDTAVDEIVLRLIGHSTQTNELLLIEKSDGTDLLNVTNINGTKIRGTTTNDSAAAGFVGEYIEAKVHSSSTSTPASTQFGDAESITLTGGDWDVQGTITFTRNGATYTVADLEVGVSAITGNDGTNLAASTTACETNATVPLTFTTTVLQTPLVRVTSDGTNLTINGVTTNTTQVIYLKIYPGTFSGAAAKYQSFFRARRVR